MDTTTGEAGNSGADSESGTGSWLGDAFNAAGDFLHEHGPYAAMSPTQQETAQNVIGQIIGGSDTPATAGAPQPPAQTAPSPNAAAQPDDSPAQPGPSDMQLAHAALICGYTAKDAPRLMDNFGLARYFGISLPFINVRQDDFYRRWVIKNSRDALDGCTVLPRVIVQQPQAAPQAAPQISPDIWSWKTAEDLLSDTGHVLKEVAGGVVEPILHMATGVLAKPISDIAGLAATGYDAVNGTDDAQRASSFREYVRDAMTYEPRTEAGASIYNPQNLIPAWFGKLLDLTLPKAPVDSSTAGGMATNALREAVPQILNIAGAKYIPLVPKAIRGEIPEVERSVAPEAPAARAETPAPNETVSGPDTAPAETPSPRRPAEPETKTGKTETPATEEPAVEEPGNGEAPAADPGAPEASPTEESSAPEPQALPPETARRAVLDFARTAQLAKILQGTRLCRENPALCSQVVREMAAQGDMHTLYVPKEAFKQMAQGRGTTSDALLAQMPETQANGGLLAIPAQEYFTALPEGMASDLSPLAKTHPARSSLAEVVEQALQNGSKQSSSAWNEEGNNRPPVDVSGKAVPTSEHGVHTYNRKNIANHAMMKGNPEASDLEAANREAYAAELAAGRPGVKTVYVGTEADRLINGKGRKVRSADVVSITSDGRYHIYEAGGSDVSPTKIEQLQHTGQQLGPEKVLRQTLVMKENITTKNCSVKSGMLIENGEPKLINGKPVYVIFTTQGR